MADAVALTPDTELDEQLKAAEALQDKQRAVRPVFVWVASLNLNHRTTHHLSRHTCHRHLSQTHTLHTVTNQPS